MSLLGSLKTKKLNIIFAFFLLGCASDDSSLIIDIDVNTLVKKEEYSLKSNQLLLDSLRTDGESIFVVGQASHPHFGTISATGYGQIRHFTGIQQTDSITADSLFLYLGINDYKLNGSDSVVRLAFYNAGDILFENVVYTSEKQIEIPPRAVDTLEVKVPKVKGHLSKIDMSGFMPSFFSELQLLTPDNFNRYTKTLVFAPVDPSELITIRAPENTNDSTRLVLYSSKKFGDTTNYVTTYFFTGLKHTYIERDRTGSLLANLQDLDTFKINSDTIFHNPLFGVKPVLDFTPLKNIAVLDETILVNKAEIEIPLYSPDSISLQSIRFYFYKEISGIFGEGFITDPFHTLILDNQTYLGFSRDALLSNADDGRYFADITIYVQQYIDYYKENGEFLNDRIVLIGASSLYLNQSVLNSDSPRLRVYYTSVVR